MKKIFTILFLFISFWLNAATRTWVGTTSANWNVNTNWAEGAFATSIDDVVFGVGQVNPITTNVASACKTIDFTNYGGTLTMTSTLTVSGNVKLITGMTITGAASLTINATATLTSNTAVWPGDITFISSPTVTLSDDWTVSGSIVNTSGATTLNSHSLFFATNLTMTNGTLSGTANLVANGTGAWTKGASGAFVSNNLEINTAGTFTIVSPEYKTGTLKYTTGTVSHSGTLTVIASATLNTNGINWNNITLNGAITITNSSALTINGSFVLNNNSVIYTLNGSDFNINGTTTNSAGITISGTAKLVLGGGAFLSGTAIVNNNIDIAGNVTFRANATTFTYKTGTLKYVSGTPVFTNNTILISASCTLDLAGCTPNNITCNTATQTLTLASNLTISGDFTTNQTLTFDGALDVQAASFNCITPGKTITFRVGRTYTWTSYITIVGTPSSKVNLVSSTPSSSYNFVLNSGASCNVNYVNSTDADSSAGRIIHDMKGTLIRTVNWYITNPDFFPMFQN